MMIYPDLIRPKSPPMEAWERTANGGAGTIYLKDAVNNEEKLIVYNSVNPGPPTPVISEDGSRFDLWYNLTSQWGSYSCNRQIDN